MIFELKSLCSIIYSIASFFFLFEFKQSKKVLRLTSKETQITCLSYHGPFMALYANVIFYQRKKIQNYELRVYDASCIKCRFCRSEIGAETSMVCE